MSESGHYTCEHYKAELQHGLVAANEEYWTQTWAGLTRRVDSLSQVFTYGVYNNAVKILGDTKEVTWMRWVTAPDDRVCPICVENSKKGSGQYPGWWKSGWFTPAMPAHPNCMNPGTLVSTINGLVPIENLKIGDLVLTHKGRYRPITFVHKNFYDGEMREILGVSMTANHPVLTPEGWRRADGINDGSKVVADRKIFPKTHLMTTTVNDNRKSMYKGIVYNLTVMEDETYLVGWNRLVVHNCRCQWQLWKSIEAPPPQT